MALLLGSVLMIVGFLVYLAGFTTAVNIDDGFSILPPGALEERVMRAAVSFALQLVGGFTILGGVIASFRSVALGAQSRAVQLQRQLSQSMETHMTSIEKRLNDSISNFTRRVDNSYKLLDERMSALENVLRGSNVSLAKPLGGQVCRFCGAEVSSTSSFCPDCGRSQH